MLTRLNFTRNPYVSSVFLCAVAFVLLNAPAFAVDTTNDGAMTVLSMEEMESLAGGSGHHKGPKIYPAKSACDTGWRRCPSPSTRRYRDCACEGSLQSQPCSTHYNGVPLWKDYSCRRDWILRCAVASATGAQGGIRYKCNN